MPDLELSYETPWTLVVAILFVITIFVWVLASGQ